MKTKNLITIQQFCDHYDVPIGFVNALQEYELIEVVRLEDTVWLRKTQIKEVEIMIRLHYELNINMEGIDAVYHLLKQIETLQDNILELKNKLNCYKEY